MIEAIKKLTIECSRIKSLGWVKGIGKGKGNIGITFESLLGIEKNEFEIPDYYGIEIKTKRIRNVQNPYITLFSFTPYGKYFHEVERIKDTYGYPHRCLREYKILNNCVYCNKKNKIGNRFYFKLFIDRNDKKVFLCVYDLYGNLLERDVYWDFETIREKLYRKLKILAFVKAYSKFDNSDNEYFKYNECSIYLLKDFSTFISLLERGVIRINFKINIWTKGDKIGKIHDHGTSFDILEKDIEQLFTLYNF